MVLFLVALSLLVIFLLVWQLSLLIATLTGSPIVYADKKAIQDCLKLAGASPGQTVIDLGCGNARALIIAAEEFGAMGVGVDRSLYSLAVSKINIWRRGQGKKVKVVWGDFRAVEKELFNADVVYLYLSGETLAEIESWLFKSIGQQTKIVSLAFSFSNHQPSRTSKTRNLGQQTTIGLYS